MESDSAHDLEIFSVSTVNNKAELKLIGDLDFENEQLHQLRIVAKDRANFGRVNSATTGLLIKVQDIEDKPPEFVSVPSVTRIAEDVPTFTEVSTYLYVIYQNTTLFRSPFFTRKYELKIKLFHGTPLSV